MQLSNTNILLQILYWTWPKIVFHWGLLLQLKEKKKEKIKRKTKIILQRQKEKLIKIKESNSNKQKTFFKGGKRSALARGQRPRPHFTKFVCFWRKSLWTPRLYENYFLPKRGSDYVTATEFVSAPISKFIDPSISHNYVFLLFLNWPIQNIKIQIRRILVE